MHGKGVEDGIMLLLYKQSLFSHTLLYIHQTYESIEHVSCVSVTPGTFNSGSLHCWQCGSKVVFVFVVRYRNILLTPLFIANDFLFCLRPLLFSALVYPPTPSPIATSPTSSRRTVVGSKQNSSTVSAQLTAGT